MPIRQCETVQHLILNVWISAAPRLLYLGATDLCLLPMEEGSCQRYTLRWYFNSQVRACRPFIYSGCKGNDNRFLHLEECEEACLGETKRTGRHADTLFQLNI
uniref:BPTI/Kunitz inhibitor domain-containing protein n=1 Tax=Fundulus heteroclitus TaxID=8078 RepID=A0A3Q2QEN1_FUNHE